MEEYVNNLVFKNLRQKPHVTHKMLTDNTFMLQERELAIVKLKESMKANDALFREISLIHLSRQERLKTELRIINKYLCMSPAQRTLWSKTLIKYTKEERLYRKINGLTDLTETLDKDKINSDDVETFSEWLSELPTEELAIVTNLIADL